MLWETRIAHNILVDTFCEENVWLWNMHYRWDIIKMNQIFLDLSSQGRKC